MSLSLTEIQRHRAELVERARAERVAVRAVLDGHSNLFWLVQPLRALRWAARAWGLFRIVRKISRAFA